MSEENEALVRSAYDPSFDNPQPQVCHGRDQLTRALRRQAGQGLASQVEEVISAPGGQVVVIARTPGVDQQRAWQNGDRNILVLTVSAGQIVAMRAFRDQAEASSFAGLT